MVARVGCHDNCLLARRPDRRNAAAAAAGDDDIAGVVVVALGVPAPSENSADVADLESNDCFSYNFVWFTLFSKYISS